MPNYAVRERPYRARSRMREEPRGDAITTAITAQVVICVLLVIGAMGLKHLDNGRFAEIKLQYSVMLEESTEADQAVAWFSVLTDRIESVKARLFPKDKSEVAQAADEPADEPEDEPLGEFDFEAPEKVAAEYDYLGNENVSYLSGSGGMNPVNAEEGMLLSPPAGSSLSPVYLSTRMKPPITGVITSGFAYRYHPVTNESDFHTGIDIAAEEGRAILAALPGEVEEIGESDIYGKYIVLKHATNLKTSYSHCSEIIAEEGMAVRQGERIALVGQTGVATGPHLHFSVIVEDEFYDPGQVLGDYIKLVEE